MSEQNVVESSPETGGEAFEGDFGNDFEGGADDDGAGGAQSAPGMGQSKSSRRRRRKRKKLAGAPGTPAGVAGDNGTGEGGTAGSEGVAADYAPIVMEGESLALVSASAPAVGNGSQSAAPQTGNVQTGNFQTGNFQTNNLQANGSPSRRPAQPNQGNGGAQGQGPAQAKRWKKKFRDRERRPGTPGGSGGEPRNDGNHGGSGFSGDRSPNGDRSSNGDRGYERPHRREGGRPDNFGNLVSTQHRKVKTGGGKERGFVGPMDHSYREVTSEFGEAPPSTIQLRGRRGHRHQGDNQPIDHNQPRPVPISENAQTHIYLFVEDLFITAKVQETARKLGVKVAFIKNEKEAISELTSGEEANRPSLIVFDLNNANAKPLTLIPKLKTKLKRSASIIGFLSTIQGDLKAKAVEAGIDTVMPKAAFSQNLPNLLRRYGVEEVEEVNYNY